jgi:hypothetical protein
MDNFHPKQLAIVIPTKQYQASIRQTLNHSFFIRENGFKDKEQTRQSEQTLQGYLGYTSLATIEPISIGQGDLHILICHITLAKPS